MMILFGLVLKSSNKEVSDIKVSLRIYLGGLLLTLIMLITRGTLHVLSPNTLKPSIDAMISGFAGIGHAVLGVGLIMTLFKFKKLVLKVKIKCFTFFNLNKIDFLPTKTITSNV